MQRRRFYPLGKAGRIGITVLWAALGLYWIDMLTSAPHRRPAMATLWALIAAFNLVNAWTTFWTVEPEAVVQHSLFWQKRYCAENVRYAGPVRRPAMKRWLRKSIELSVAGYSSERYVNVKDRSGFLHALRNVAPRAEIVL